ncbi:MAG: hypothetical protein IRY89_13620 [Pseudolabrys sp.]|nr:hypothetical protein [Pseudolabrys sp.]
MTVSSAIATAGEAEQVLADFAAIMERLEETIAEETARVRAGRLRAAAELGPVKSELADRFMAECARLGAAGDMIARALPQAVDALRRRQAALQSLLRTNLTVLATAQAVAEGIIRGVSDELARRRAPSTYGADGRAAPPASRASQPLALSRTL